MIEDHDSHISVGVTSTYLNVFMIMSLIGWCDLSIISLYCQQNKTQKRLISSSILNFSCLKKYFFKAYNLHVVKFPLFNAVVIYEIHNRHMLFMNRYGTLRKVFMYYLPVRCAEPV